MDKLFILFISFFISFAYVERSFALQPSSLEFLDVDTKKNNRLPMEWDKNVESILNRIFTQYAQFDGDVLTFGARKLTYLSAVLKTVDFNNSDVYSHISELMKNSFLKLSLPESGESDNDIFTRTTKLKRLTYEAAIFVEGVLRMSAPYKIDHPAMVDLLEGRGWNCTSISYLTELIVSEEWGAGNALTVAQIAVSQDGKHFPVDSKGNHDPNGVGHVSNLVWVPGALPVFADEGVKRRHPLFKGIDENNMLFDMKLDELTDHPQWRGMLVTDLTKFTKADMAFKRIIERNNDLSKSDLNAPDGYFKDQFQTLKEEALDLEKRPEYHWVVGNTNVKDLHDILNKNITATLASEIINDYNLTIADLNERIKKAQDAFQSSDFIVAKKLYQDTLERAQIAKSTWAEKVNTNRDVLSAVKTPDINLMIEQIDTFIQVAEKNLKACEHNAGIWNPIRGINQYVNQENPI
ncbi:MAG: hypothetical protein HQL22_04180 [Candidatus Omnitrophica bacterium]|nr:hypothetical protein [Candidatus Omnitrophota bacterium]